MFQNFLKDEDYDSIYINSWQNDFFDEPIITILSELITYTKHNSIILETASKKLKNTLLTVVGSSAMVTNQVIKKLSGIDIKSIGEEVEKEIYRRDIEVGNAIFQEYNEKKKLFGNPPIFSRVFK